MQQSVSPGFSRHSLHREPTGYSAHELCKQCLFPQKQQGDANRQNSFKRLLEVEITWVNIPEINLESSEQIHPITLAYNDRRTEYFLRFEWVSYYPKLIFKKITIMNPSKPAPGFTYNPETQAYILTGDWSIHTLDNLVQRFSHAPLPQSKKIMIDGSKISRFDTAGALALLHCIEDLKKRDNSIEQIGFSEQQQSLLELVKSKSPDLGYRPPASEEEDILYQVGVETINKYHQINGLLILIGDLAEKIVAAAGQWRRFQFPSIVSTIYGTGVTALPIIGLLSFLIGVVLAYQMGLQLETYGANIFIAFLSGMAIFREFGPLITAIIVAGRTSSAFTAQLGSMKINEEIDALYTMGLSPTELLVVPRVLGLLLVFPLLIFWSDFFSTIGAMIMSKFMLHVGYNDFLTRLQDTVGLKQMMLGLYKAPAFAILIALVGCFQGFRVEANADSVGTQTTKSVVQALFLIIIADATYSVIYSWLDV
ncbi:putative ABC transport system permease [Legionella londiniensis]|uniref:ABC transporter permease n=2 Tax=Legionella londiniensis TaxID=45068 RepID=A0A0W0VPI3_9GAMM|nr:ABC transporter permease [Legionella londiniensis]STX94004.1 putative ABC transport system permease [Legionella londiniensis]